MKHDSADRRILKVKHIVGHCATVVRFLHERGERVSSCCQCVRYDGVVDQSLGGLVRQRRRSIDANSNGDRCCGIIEKSVEDMVSVRRGGSQDLCLVRSRQCDVAA